MSDEFWSKLPSCSKLDVLDERRHNRVIVSILKDPSTDIEQVNRTDYSLYGREEAVLIQPKALALRIGLIVFMALAHFLKPIAHY